MFLVKGQIEIYNTQNFILQYNSEKKLLNCKVLMSLYYCNAAPIIYTFTSKPGNCRASSWWIIICDCCFSFASPCNFILVNPNPLLSSSFVHLHISKWTILINRTHFIKYIENLVERTQDTNIYNIFGICPCYLILGPNM